MIITSAPGKLVLFGEHASRHGKPILVQAVDSRVYAILKPRKDGKIFLTSKNYGVVKEKWPNRKLDILSATIKKFSEKTGASGGFDLEIKSDVNAGTGSSNAVTVAALGALNEHFGASMKKKEIADTAFEISSGVAGYGSGMDVAASTYGGIIYYVKGKVTRVVTNKNLPLVVGNTGIKAKSGSIIKGVQYLEKKYPALLTVLIDRVGEIVDEAERAIRKSDFQTLGELMNINHGILCSMGVSSIELEKLVFAARKAGAFGAKLSGAGIGDNMIALAAGNEKQVSNAIRTAGGKILPVKVGEGLRLEKSG
ncbi:MAG: mevalonate kinase [Candidatus Aenigmarchaeota archaeon]|nr:mevalonate kinase [Candidatus Aenigmarchaeota archaeon]